MRLNSNSKLVITNSAIIAYLSCSKNSFKNKTSHFRSRGLPLKVD